MNKYLVITSTMTAIELDNWYENHVGYRLSEDDESLVGNIQAHRYAIAEMMCLHDHGEGDEYYNLLDEI